MSDATPSVLRVGIIVVSDRASSGVYDDLGGPAIREAMTAYLQTPWQEVYRLIPDDRAVIERTLRTACDEDGCALVLTTGGTGPAPRDVTPEATVAVCDKLLPGFGELMRATSLKYALTAVLSRQTAGIRGRSLIINLPGRPKAVRECLDAVFPAVPDCLDLIGGPRIEAHAAVIQIYRPPRV